MGTHRLLRATHRDSLWGYTQTLCRAKYTQRFPLRLHAHSSELCTEIFFGAPIHTLSSELRTHSLHGYIYTHTLFKTAHTLPLFWARQTLSLRAKHTLSSRLHTHLITLESLTKDHLPPPKIKIKIKRSERRGIG